MIWHLISITGNRFSTSPNKSRPGVGTTQPPVSSYPSKWPRSVADHSIPQITEVKNEQGYIPTPPACLHCVNSNIIHVYPTVPVIKFSLSIITANNRKSCLLKAQLHVLFRNIITGCHLQHHIIFYVLPTCYQLQPTC